MNSQNEDTPHEATELDKMNRKVKSKLNIMENIATTLTDLRQQASEAHSGNWGLVKSHMHKGDLHQAEARF